MKPSITAIIITKNEALMIANCIETLRWCNEILVVDNKSDDGTADIAEKLGARVISFASTSFALSRQKALQYVKTDWLFYIDADERVTPTLSQEILVHVETQSSAALELKRENVMYGKTLRYGGWQDDTVTRVFQRSALQSWVGDIHESPEFTGNVTTLHTPLLHLTHRNTIDGLKKTINWTPIEARLMYEANVSPVTLRTILRKGIMEVIRRALFKKGKQDGLEGWIEALIQGINRMLVYIQLWELQQTPSLPEKYQQTELEIANQWKKQT